MRTITSILFFIVMGGTVRSQSSKLYFSSRENTRVSVNTNYYYQFSAADSNGKTVSYSIAILPGWLHYNIADHSISGRSATTGQFRVKIMAGTRTDSIGQSYMLTVYDKQTANILCLGNSITNGVDSFNSYRRDLWQMLHAGNYNFDLIGSWSRHHMGSNVPVPDFDMDHEGHSGWTFEDILTQPSWDSARGNLNEWINAYYPTIVLIELGTNDVFHCLKPGEMFVKLDLILALLRKRNRRIKIFLAQIPPLGAQWSDKKLCGNDTTYAAAIIHFNKEIVLYARAHSATQSPITVVDQFTGVDPAKDMFDDIHPNTNGERKMAERWFRAIQPWVKKLY